MEETIIKTEPNSLTLLNSGDVLTFKEGMDTKTYIKVKRNMMRMSMDKNKNEPTINLTVETDYFSDLCIEIKDKNNINKPINQEYLDKLSLPDFMQIEEKLKDLFPKA